jgi:hypothetical protein
METEKLVAHARARFDHATARRVLKEKYEAKLLFAHGGGMWRAGPELQCVLLACAQDTDVVLLDLYETPVPVNVTELFALSHERWQEQMNAWHVEHENLNRNR